MVIHKIILMVKFYSHQLMHFFHIIYISLLSYIEVT